jgi:hypothetical protein
MPLLPLAGKAKKNNFRSIIQLLLIAVSVYFCTRLLHDEKFQQVFQPNSVALPSSPLLQSLQSKSGSKSDPVLLATEELYATLNPRSLWRYKKQFESYSLAKPYPHAVFDDFFPMGVIKALQYEIPDPNFENAFIGANKKCMRGSTACLNDTIQWGKSAFRDEQKFGVFTRTMFQYLRSAEFVSFLEKLTGIDNLIPDLKYTGSGCYSKTMCLCLANVCNLQEFIKLFAVVFSIYMRMQIFIRKFCTGESIYFYS